MKKKTKIVFAGSPEKDIKTPSTVVRIPRRLITQNYRSRQTAKGLVYLQVLIPGFLAELVRVKAQADGQSLSGWVTAALEREVSNA